MGALGLEQGEEGVRQAQEDGARQAQEDQEGAYPFGEDFDDGADLN